MRNNAQTQFMTRPKAPIILAMWLVGALSLAIGCNRHDADVDANVEQMRTHPKPHAPSTLSQESLHQQYPDIHDGDTCTHDEGCDSPLRCMRGECRFPAAMTGVEQDADGVIDIQTGTDTVRYRVEYAVTPYERRQGLMNRQHMQDGFGMLFVFESSQQQAFWMKNTLIPLDMIFITHDHRVDSIIHDATPHSLTPRKSEGAVPYVLELNAGEAKAWGIKAGDTVTITPRGQHANP